jgi:hypothetical protein
MKPSRRTIVLLGLAMLVPVFLWMTPTSKTQGVLSGAELKSVATIVPAPVIHANDLILVEFFAGY